MKEEFRFYKTDNDRWFIDLPKWKGNINDLELALGADVLLDYLSKGKKDISIILSDKSFDEAKNKLIFARLGNEYESGAFYVLHNEYNAQIWLCDVVKFIFNDFPMEIYFKVM